METEPSSQAAIAASLLREHKGESFIDYKWEELVGKMCCSEDPGLRKLGHREFNTIKLKNPAFKFRCIGRIKLD